jgi:2-dehydro-3-deoxyphosphogluconate aldolase/(4S)-4-hydroxy-2-oxoglutarate aldolase
MSAVIVPILTLDDPGFAAELAPVLAEAGITVAEVTLRTARAVEAIERMAWTPGLRIAAGTVLEPRQVIAAVDAGATWIVSPGLDDEVVSASQERGVLPVPGVATATECQRARRLGLDRVKVFPVDLLGGRRMIDSLAAPFPELRFLPSGGLDEASAPELLAHPSVFAIGSSWATGRDLVGARDLEEISSRCRRLVAIAGAGGRTGEG